MTANMVSWPTQHPVQPLSSWLPALHRAWVQLSNTEIQESYKNRQPQAGDPDLLAKTMAASSDRESCSGFLDSIPWCLGQQVTGNSDNGEEAFMS